MKALLIASVLLFSLRAMSSEVGSSEVGSSEVGENKKSPCLYADQGKRESKDIEQDQKENVEKVEESTAKSI